MRVPTAFGARARGQLERAKVEDAMRKQALEQAARRRRREKAAEGEQQTAAGREGRPGKADRKSR